MDRGRESNNGKRHSYKKSLSTIALSLLPYNCTHAVPGVREEIADYLCVSFGSMDSPRRHPRMSWSIHIFPSEASDSNSEHRDVRCSGISFSFGRTGPTPLHLLPPSVFEIGEFGCPLWGDWIDGASRLRMLHA